MLHLIQLSGDVPAVMKALEEIGYQLRSDSEPQYSYCNVFSILLLRIILWLYVTCISTLIC